MQRSSLIIIFLTGVTFVTVALFESSQLREGPVVSYIEHSAPASGTHRLWPALSFEANRGQVNKQVEFLTRTEGYTLFLTPTAAVMTFNNGLRKGSDVLFGDFPDKAPGPFSLRLQWLGAAVAPVVTGVDQLAGTRNYFIGGNPQGWYTDIPTYKKVRYENVYAGVDLIFYETHGDIEYDFIVSPGADAGAVRLAFRGGSSAWIDNQGNLVLTTPVGMVVNHAPYVYQETQHGRQRISAEYVLTGATEDSQRVGFKLASYDKNKPLVIDPSLTFSSYLGGSNADEARAIAADDNGNIYVTGATQSLNFPGDNGLRNPNLSDIPGATDAFVSKYNNAGQLIFSTYLGGSGSLGDAGNGIAVDGNGRIYVTGRAHPGFVRFPTTTGAFNQWEGNTEVFVSVLEADGSSFVYSALIGGGLGDSGQGIALDDSGNVYVAGNTASDSNDNNPFPTRNAYQASSDGVDATIDGFALKLNPAGNGDADLIYSTYLSGSGVDEANGIVVDAMGRAHVTGRTSSTDFQTTTGTLQTGSGGSNDAFVVKLGAAGDTAEYATYLGGSGTDAGLGIALDGTGSAYVVGQTASSGTFGGTVGGATDAFVAKLKSDGSALTYSTLIGGSGGEEAASVAVDGSGNAHVTGWTSSTNFPASANLVTQTGYGGGASDAFIAKLDQFGNSLLYANYLGGAAVDQGRGIALAGDKLYVAGWTESSVDFPISQNASQSDYGGGNRDAFVTRIGPFADLSLTVNDDEPVDLGGILTYSLIVTNNGPDTATNVILTDTLPADAVYQSDDGGCSENAGTVTCNLGSLGSGAMTTVQIEATINTTDTITNSGIVTADEFDYPSTNNSDSEDTAANTPGVDDGGDSGGSNGDTPFIVIGPDPGDSNTNTGDGGAVSTGGAVAWMDLLILLVASVAGRCCISASREH